MRFVAAFALSVLVHCAVSGTVAADPYLDLSDYESEVDLPARTSVSGLGVPPEMPAEQMKSVWQIPGSTRSEASDKALFGLGRLLFYEQRLSRDGKVSCALCHQQQAGFADTRARSPGVTGELTKRNSPSLFNLAWRDSWGWDGAHTSLADQIRRPLFGSFPAEHGLTREQLGMILQDLQNEPQYVRFVALLENKPDYFLLSESLAIAALSHFVRGLVSFDSAWDRAVRLDDRSDFDAAALRGLTLFASQRLQCGKCHSGVLLDGFPNPERFWNTGFNTDERSAFRVPSLRNVARTAPYMHDGSLPDLNAVIDHYARGGQRSAELTLPAFVLSAAERADLLAFLDSLTDEQALTNPQFSNPHIIDD